MTADKFEEKVSIEVTQIPATVTVYSTGTQPPSTDCDTTLVTVEESISISDDNTTTNISTTKATSGACTSASLDTQISRNNDNTQAPIPIPIPTPTTIIPESVLSRPKRQRFLPLNNNKNKNETNNLLTLKGIIFDLDGTLCVPQTWMFSSMRAALGIPKSTDILNHITSLTPPSLQSSAYEKIKAIETEAMKQMVPSIGLVPLLTFLSEKSIKRGICTRNFEGPVRHLVSNFCNGFEFEPIITREFHPPKPHPAGLLHIARAWGLKVGISGKKEVEDEDEMKNVIMVGDSIDDMIAGRKAGSVTCLLLGEHNSHLVNKEEVDLVISRLDELIGLLDVGLEVFDDIPTNT